MSLPTSRCEYIRLDERYNPLSSQHSYIVYDLNWERMNRLAMEEQAEAERRLVMGQKALADRQFTVAVDAFEWVLRLVPQHLEAQKGLDEARENALKELSETNPNIHIILKANNALDRLLDEYGDRDHPKNVLEKFRERLLVISGMYQSVREFDRNCPIPKFPQLRSCYQKVEKQIRKCVRTELTPGMDMRLRAMEGLSLKNERHLNAILAHCRAWDQAYSEGAFLLGSDQMYNKAQVDQIFGVAALAKQRLENIGLFFVEAIDQAILEVIPKWEMAIKNRWNLISYYNVIFMNSPLLRSRWMNLTPKGMEILKEKMKNHVHKVIQSKSWFTCFFARTLQRKLNHQPPVFEEHIEDWLNQISEAETIQDIPERLKMIRFECKEGDAGNLQTFGRTL